jgi:hypothetical protein
MMRRFKVSIAEIPNTASFLFPLNGIFTVSLLSRAAAKSWWE